MLTMLFSWYVHYKLISDHRSFKTYLLTLPLFTGVSRVRALSPAWTGSHARETLISRTISPQQKNQGQ